jgi:transcriptional regulator with XRE-family HTH domain
MARPKKKQGKASPEKNTTIRRLREARNTSHQDLAGRIKVPPDTLEAWENGTARPSAGQLSSLAFEFGCRSEDLQSERDENARKILTNTYYISTDRKIEDGWWGHLGVKLPGHDQSKWFPITLGTADRVAARLRGYEEDEKWIIVETLNNRMLVINPLATRRLWLLDDAQDEPSGDWSIPIDGYSGQPAEFYKALEKYTDVEKHDLPESIVKHIEGFTDVEDLGEDEINQLLFDTHIHDGSGACASYWVDAAKLVELVESIEFEAPPRIIDLSCDSFDSYFPSNHIAMIDMPRTLVLKELEQLAGEDE